MLGLSFEAFTALHTAISLVAIAAGLLLVPSMLRGERAEGLTAFFLATTALTSITGFMFPFRGWLPSHTFGAISLVALASAAAARYGLRLTGHWRTVYVVAALFSLYLNLFVLVVQAFQKTPLARLAPTQSEWPFLAAQLALLVLMVLTGRRALRRFAT
jgi:hypothetical protein